MNLPCSPLYPVLGMMLAVGVLCPAPAAGENREDVQTLHADALASMEADQWEEALKLLTRCIELHGEEALARFGPQFGVTWYRKGICELRLKRWEAAVKSFETCYRQFPNPGEGSPDAGNLFQKRALLRWGEAAQGAGNHEEAIRMFKKFLEERDKTRDTFDPGSYYINLSICHSKLNKIPEGIENLETAIKNKSRFRTPEAGIVAAFQALVAAAIDKRDEASLLSFIEGNRAEIVSGGLEMETYAPVFLKLASDALGAGMEAGAIALCQLVPSTDVMIEDLKSRISRLGSRPEIEDPNRVQVKEVLQASLDRLERQRREGDPNEVTQLGVTAFVHEKHGNTRGAFAAYEQLELHFPKSKKREDHLYHLVRTSSVIGDARSTGRYGAVFLKDFPDSKHVAPVRRMMLVSLFQEGEYDACITVASGMLPELPEGSEEHDICLHVLGGSYYYTGRHEQARPLLDQHVEKYPKSRFEQAALYFQASNLSRLRLWPEAAGLLDAFLGKHPDPSTNLYYPFSLFDRANCHFASNENAEALAKLDRLEKEYPGAEILDRACHLKGDVLQEEGRLEEAENFYKKALELAEHRGNRLVAGESLRDLVTLLGGKSNGKSDNPRAKDAVRFADKFWKEHGGDSPFKAQVAIAQSHALMATGRGEEALTRLRETITELAALPDAPGLEEAVHTYTGAYLEGHEVDELKDHYDHFPEIGSQNQSVRALLRLAVIDASEDELARTGGNRAAEDKAEARIKILFQELKNDFDVKQLSDHVLVRTGDFLREKTSAPRQSLPYYDEVLSRRNPPFRFAANFGRASVLATGSQEERAEALDVLKRMLAESDNEEERELALFGILQAQMSAGDHEAAATTATRYLSDENGRAFNRFAPEVGLALAKSCQELGRSDDALAHYQRVWSRHSDLIHVSAPAMIAWMELSWQRNSSTGGPGNRSDRQHACESGRSYLDQTRALLDKMSDEERKIWLRIEARVGEYEAAPGVESNTKPKKEAAGK